MLTTTQPTCRVDQLTFRGTVSFLFQLACLSLAPSTKKNVQKIRLFRRIFDILSLLRNISSSIAFASYTRETTRKTSFDGAARKTLTKGTELVRTYGARNVVATCNRSSFCLSPCHSRDAASQISQCSKFCDDQLSSSRTNFFCTGQYILVFVLKIISFLRPKIQCVFDFFFSGQTL